ncbi:MAG: DUF1667 domain-containing protein [Chloroflexi bacterium]|nr:DUF1667 domain-containing protein [Chloroflexota bacterium]
MKGVIVCVVCPVSCPVEVEWDEHDVLDTDHNQCKLALPYVKSEIFDPRRTVTSSVVVEGGVMPLASVKTDRPIPKALVMQAMSVVLGIRVAAPVRIGDVVARDLLGTGANLVATRDVEAAP